MLNKFMNFMINVDMLNVQYNNISDKSYIFLFVAQVMIELKIFIKYVTYLLEIVPKVNDYP